MVWQQNTHSYIAQYGIVLHFRKLLHQLRRCTVGRKVVTDEDSYEIWSYAVGQLQVSAV